MTDPTDPTDPTDAVAVATQFARQIQTMYERVARAAYTLGYTDLRLATIDGYPSGERNHPASLSGVRSGVRVPLAQCWVEIDIDAARVEFHAQVSPDLQAALTATGAEYER